MKSFKKLAGLALALIMALALMAPAMAADATSITVNNAIDGKTYTAYKMFDATTTESGEQGAFTVNSAWADFFKEGGDGYSYVTISSTGYVTAMSFDTALTNEAADWEEAQTFAMLALEYAEKNGVTGYSKVAADGKAVIDTTGAGYGYFVIDSSVGALCMVQTNLKNVTISEKNELPGIEKTVTYPAGTHIGDTVNYTIEVPVVAGATKYVIYDVLSNGLTYNANSFALDVYMKFGEEWRPGHTVEDVAWSKTNKVTVAEGENKIFEVSMDDDFMLALGEDEDEYMIRITYTATINENAVAVNGNTATLNYGNGEHVSSTTQTHEQPDVKLYQFEVKKVDGEGNALTGAEFKLYDAKTDGNEIYVKNAPAAAAGKYDYVVTPNADEATTIKAGNVKIFGLGDGDYFLEETVAPDGYNQLTERKQLTIAGADLVTDSAVEVINQSGATLPATGGIGTTIFYTLGGLLLVGSVILFVTKKRTGMAD